MNPLQFGPSEDLDAYPRDHDGDAALLRSLGVDALFLPTPASIYPSGHATRVQVGRVTEVLCGRDRPTHFEGVTTVVMALLQIAGPCRAFFGRKDFQQWRVIGRMATDLFLPVEIVGLPIVREADGLALSSRNAYLDDAQRLTEADR